MKRRTLLLATAASPLLTGCIWPNEFELAWDEEVQLHDGRVAVVSVLHRYQRYRNHLLNRYADAIFRGNEFTFDAGETIGRIKLVSRLGVKYLDQIEGNWYAVLFGQGPYGNNPDEMPDRWGHDFTRSQERLAIFRNGRFEPISWDLAPPNSILRTNLMVGSMPVGVLASLNGKRVTLIEKQGLRVKYPPGPGAAEIDRPLRFYGNRIRGEKK